MFPGPTMSGYSWSHQVPRAPLRAQGVTSRAGTSRIPSAGTTPPSSLLQAHAPILNPPTAYGRGLDRRVFAGCCQPPLGVGPSRRCLCESVSACLNPYPGRSCGARTRFFPQNNGLPDVMTRSALGNTRTAISVRRLFRGCSYSIIFRPADLLAPPIAPTAAPFGTRQPGLLLLRISRSVTSQSRRYTIRPLSGN